jgi:predicted nuclease of predicted toxin-antitoxin system
MPFLANENFCMASVRLLRRKGIEVSSVNEDAQSSSDKTVIQRAINEGLTILTHDRDYGELIFKDGFRPDKGVIYFRLKNYLPEVPAQLLLAFLENPAFEFVGYFTVIDNDLTIRQRKIV